MSRKFALIIGNSEYQDARLSRLVTPNEDAHDLAEVLRAPDIGGFAEVVTLVNETSANVRLEIETFFSDKKRDDLLLLYFSGHGVRDDQGYLYLAVKDTRHNRLRATAVPASYITSEMDTSRSQRQVLILDCCHSGAFAQGMKGTPGESVGTASAFKGTGYGRVVLTASDSTQYAWEGEGDQVVGEAENSVFTHYLIEGLQTGAADRDADGQIGLDELYDYVFTQVVTRTPKQTPHIWLFGQEGQITIAQNPHPVQPKPAELPLELRQLIESPIASARRAAINELSSLLSGSIPGLALAAQQALTRLVEDDSRSVAHAASQVLAKYAEAQRAKAGTETETHATEDQAKKTTEERTRPEVAERTQARAEPVRTVPEASGRLAAQTLKEEPQVAATPDARQKVEREAPPGSEVLKPMDFLFWLKWISVHAIGIGLFLFILFFTDIWGSGNSDSWFMSLGMFGGLAGVWGWLILRQYGLRLGWLWIVGNIAVAGIMGAVGGASGATFDGPPIFLILLILWPIANLIGGPAAISWSRRTRKS
jgi:uncharacterized caspase-like protein